MDNQPEQGPVVPTSHMLKTDAAKVMSDFSRVWDEMKQYSDSDLITEESHQYLLQHCHERYRASIEQLWSQLCAGQLNRETFPVQVYALVCVDLMPSDGDQENHAGPAEQDTAGPAEQVVAEPAEQAAAGAVNLPPSPAVATPPPDPAVAPPPPDPTVTFSPKGGDFSTPLTVELTCPIPGADIRYTMDGSAPTAASPRYPAERLTIDRSVTVTAQVIDNGELLGTPVCAPYVMRVGSVQGSLPGGTYNPPVTISLSCDTDGAAIFYTLDGSAPSAAATRYEARDPLLLQATASVRAVACKDGWTSSDLFTAAYVLKSPEWLVIEPQNQTDAVPHEIADVQHVQDAWTIAAASVRGKLHAHRGLWRDDSYHYTTEGPWTLLAVADGAGSAPLSRIGSRIACDKAIAHLTVLLNNQTLQEPAEAQQPAESDLVRLREFLVSAAREAKTALAAEAAARSRPVNEFAATLLIVIHCRWKGYDFAASIQVGDGAIALWNADDTVSLLGVADHGEHSSETKFLTTKQIEQEFLSRVLFTMKKDLRGIAVMSDGVSDDFFPEEQRMIELFTGTAIPGMLSSDEQPVDGVAASVLPDPQPGQALLAWLRYTKKGSSDDRTLVLFFRRNS